MAVLQSGNRSAHPFHRDTGDIPVRARILLAAVFAAALSIAGPFALPIGTVPITLTTLVLVLDGYLLGPAWGLLPLGAYIVLGTAGLPVFSGAARGLSILAGPAGGYIVFSLFIVLFTGIFARKFRNPLLQFAGVYIGHLLYYAGGILWYMVVGHAALLFAFAFGVLSFLLSDLVKAIIGVFAGFLLQKRLGANR